MNPKSYIGEEWEGLRVYTYGQYPIGMRRFEGKAQKQNYDDLDSK